MSPRRPRITGQSRQQIAQRLRDRRTHEETLILDAADALARRNAADLALSEAAEALSATLDELQKHGFELQEVAELLQIDPSELSGTGPSRRLSVRTSRSVKVQEPNETDDITDAEPAGVKPEFSSFARRIAGTTMAQRRPSSLPQGLRSGQIICLCPRTGGRGTSLKTSVQGPIISLCPRNQRTRDQPAGTPRR